jgi:hypothetical protein
MSDTPVPKPTLKGRPLSLNSDNIWDDDAFKNDASKKRSQLATVLTNLIQDEPHPLVVGLNGGWGTGKTFILQRWRLQLEKDRFYALYFNAWTDDYCGDPLIAILGQLWEHLKGSDFKESVRSLKESAGALFKQTVFHALSTTTAGIVDVSEDSFKSVAEKCIDAYSAHNESRSVVRSRLSKLANEIHCKTSHPLVFIIDELDRCRPTFAIELLERVKHIFDVDNLVFVFGIDRAQLCKSIKAVYGHIDADEYLARFIDITFSIPTPDYQVFCQATCERMGLTNLWFDKDKAARTETHRNDSMSFIRIFGYLAHQWGLSLRGVEHCLRVFFVAMKSVQPNHTVLPDLLGLLILLRYKRPHMYNQFMENRIDVIPLIDILNDAFANEKTEHSFELNYLKLHLYALKTESFEHLRTIAEGNPINKTLLAKKDADMQSTEAKSLLSCGVRNPFIGRQSSDTTSHLASLIELCAPDAKKPWER